MVYRRVQAFPGSPADESWPFSLFNYTLKRLNYLSFVAQTDVFIPTCMIEVAYLVQKGGSRQPEFLQIGSVVSSLYIRRPALLCGADRFCGFRTLDSGRRGETEHEPACAENRQHSSVATR